MEFRFLGNTGLKVSLVGIGCNNFGTRCDAARAREVVDAALDCGINFFDTADIYGQGQSEEILGTAIQHRNREQIVIATKFAGPMGEDALARGASRRHIMNAVDASLRRLGTDYIDLYQQHMPDPSTPIEETLRALDDLVREGKIRYLGNSNFTGWQIADADWTARHCGLNGFVTAQNQYSLLDRRIEREAIPACERFGLGILPYFPLASGVLTGKYRRGEAPPEGSRLANWGDRAHAALSEANFDIVEKLDDFARDNGHSLLELAMSWLAHNPVVASVIAGATSAQQVEQNASSMSWQLTEEQRGTVAALSKR